jgi:glycosyltransferase involved in cell wall biosynthesis
MSCGLTGKAFMNTFSAVIITHNEEDNIGRCLKSLLPVADEIIVVDSNSSDRTRAICEQHKVRFFTRAWEGYSPAKNFGNSLAEKDWIFSIDADEALSKELQESMLKFKEEDSVEGAFMFSRLTNYCGHWVRHCGWYPDRKMRLWKKGAGQWEGALHEQVVFSAPPILGNMTGDILHYSFPSISHHVQVMNNFSEVASDELVQRGKKIYPVLHLVLNPFYTFISKYFFSLGFLDGYYGFVICWLSAVANFLKYSKAWSKKRITSPQNQLIAK